MKHKMLKPLWWKSNLALSRIRCTIYDIRNMLRAMLHALCVEGGITRVFRDTR
jgi:hypothetical protein